MISYKKFMLSNGLKVIVHEDRSTPLAAMNLLYNAGSRDENPEFTGLAHLFEHLMFGGTLNIPEYDVPLQKAGGENNAFTNNDITDYYISIPSVNLETAFWLESDRMEGLDISQKSLETQKNVVSEEFKQRYLNQPYGDAMLLLRQSAYNVHPYRWPTIGMSLDHISRIGPDEIRNFYSSYYSPGNAILSLAGNISHDDALKLAEKWFGPVEKRNVPLRNLPPEPAQLQERIVTVEKDVPAHALYKAWHMGPRNSPEFYTNDLITDLLAGGESGRLHTKLVRDMKLFSEINAYITSDIDPGLVIITGRLMKGVDMNEADAAVTGVVNSLYDKIDDEEVEKVRNKFESSTVFSNTSILNKAMNLAYFELIGNAEMINSQVENYRKVTPEMVHEEVRRVFNMHNCTTLFYKSSRK